ncbi:ATP-binding cassette subfamily C protein LapB [Desulfobaculum xiamenense]|uniref:ATP-binding cassette subfamily C protein LapB n=1 Tax=Desulfobaculum xiamenense TaxID=995050 RepID=A0A846QJZ1_9BACT|nr:ATP-binding cassette domain-containing protein [Desulfobaculum xiamenense]NJB67437.1 ATP-binding cassette subfamily C protein LapB [Desulfobaculum xiamenense]
MREFLRRLGLNPRLTIRLVMATALVNILSFASPLFVMMILGQYTDTGFDGTLVTLSVGMLLAMLLQVGFRQVRVRMATAVSAEPDTELAGAVFQMLSRARASALDRVPAAFRRELPAHIQAVQAAYNAPNVTSALDAPFSLLFLAATFHFSPAVGVIGLVGALALLGSGLLSNARMRRVGRELQRANAVHASLVGAARSGADTVRAFCGGAFVMARWKEQSETVRGLRDRLGRLRGSAMNATVTLPVLVRVVVYAVGAREVVFGELDFPGLIVANILVSHALRQAAMTVQTGAQFARATQALAELREFFRLPLEPEGGTALRRYAGRIEFRDVAFAYPGSSGPLFESLSLSLPGGAALVVHGPNGSGKTTLARLLAGQVEPTRGEILVDGINMRQLAPQWWRQQLVFVPQEPTFLNTTLRDNLVSANPDLPQERLDQFVEQSGLGRFVAALPDGLETQIVDSGRRFPLGMRRRMALVRALATDGRLVVMDEPFEGLDGDGAKAAVAVITALAAQGRTLVVLSSDPNIIRDPAFRLDLGVKPVPAITAVGDATRQGTRSGVQAHG